MEVLTLGPLENQKLYIYDNYIYVVRYIITTSCSSSKIYYKCHSKSCKAKGVYQNDKYTPEPIAHNHRQETKLIKKLKSKFNIQKEKDEILPLNRKKQIFKKGSLHKYLNINKKALSPPIPTTIEELDKILSEDKWGDLIYSYYQVDGEKESFFRESLYSSDGATISLFMSPTFEDFARMTAPLRLYMDASFHKLKPDFDEEDCHYVVIHLYIGEISYPFMHLFMSKKSYDAYHTVMEYLRELIPQINVEIFVSNSYVSIEAADAVFEKAYKSFYPYEEFEENKRPNNELNNIKLYNIELQRRLATKPTPWKFIDALKRLDYEKSCNFYDLRKKRAPQPVARNMKNTDIQTCEPFTITEESQTVDKTFENKGTQTENLYYNFLKKYFEKVNQKLKKISAVNNNNNVITKRTKIFTRPSSQNGKPIVKKYPNFYEEKSSNLPNAPPSTTQSLSPNELQNIEHNYCSTITSTSNSQKRKLNEAPLNSAPNNVIKFPKAIFYPKPPPAVDKEGVTATEVNILLKNEDFVRLSIKLSSEELNKLETINNNGSPKIKRTPVKSMSAKRSTHILNRDPEKQKKAQTTNIDPGHSKNQKYLLKYKNSPHIGTIFKIKDIRSISDESLKKIVANEVKMSHAIKIVKPDNSKVPSYKLKKPKGLFILDPNDVTKLQNSSYSDRKSKIRHELIRLVHCHELDSNGGKSDGEESEVCEITIDSERCNDDMIKSEHSHESNRFEYSHELHQCERSFDLNQCEIKCESNRSECSYDSNHHEPYREIKCESDHPELKCDMYQSEHNYELNQYEVKCESFHSERSYESDHLEIKSESYQFEPSYETDHCEPKCESYQSEHSYESDDRKLKSESNQSECSYESDHHELKYESKLSEHSCESGYRELKYESHQSECRNKIIKCDSNYDINQHETESNQSQHYHVSNNSDSNFKFNKINQYHESNRTKSEHRIQQEGDIIDTYETEDRQKTNQPKNYHFSNQPETSHKSIEKESYIEIMFPELSHELDERNFQVLPNVESEDCSLSPFESEIIDICPRLEKSHFWFKYPEFVEEKRIYFDKLNEQDPLETIETCNENFNQTENELLDLSLKNSIKQEFDKVFKSELSPLTVEDDSTTSSVNSICKSKIENSYDRFQYDDFDHTYAMCSKVF